MKSDKIVTGWYIGDAEAEDEAELSAFFNKVAHELYVPHPSLLSLLVEEYTGPKLHAKIDNPDYEIIVCGTGTRLAGFLIGVHTEDGALRLLAGAVQPDFRGKRLDGRDMGFSDAMLMTMWSRLHDDEILQTVVPAQNTHAVNVLVRNSFVSEETPEDFRPDQTGLRLMSLRPSAMN